MNIDSHLKGIKESIDEVENAIKIGITTRQRTIGFHTAAADIFEIILHKENLITPSEIVKHEWFASKNKIKEKFNFDFKDKDEIIELIIYIEQERNKLCYGKQQPEEVIFKVINNFNKLKQKFEDLGYGKL